MVIPIFGIYFVHQIGNVLYTCSISLLFWGYSLFFMLSSPKLSSRITISTQEYGWIFIVVYNITFDKLFKDQCS